MSNDMRKPSIIKSACLALLAVTLAASFSGCASGSKTTAPAPAQIVQAAQKDMVVNISVDGNLVMPEAYDLHFGTSGDVKEVLVTEGDRVRAGAILARLDDTAQRLDIKAANNSVQTTLSNLYETVPRLPQFPTTFYDAKWDASLNGGAGGWVYIEKPRWDYVWDPASNDWKEDPHITATMGLPVGYPGYYANSTALTAYNWASDEVNAATGYFASENYTAASSELYVAMADLEASLKILEDAILNPDSGIGNITPYVPTDETGIQELNLQMDQPFSISYIQDVRSAMKTIQNGQADIEKLRGLIDKDRQEEANALFNTLLTDMQAVGKTVMNNINVIAKRSDNDIYGRDISFYLYGAAEEKLNAALKGIETGGLQSPGLSDNLRIAEHYIELCNGVLGTNDYVLQHGLSLKSENQYKVDLAQKVIALNDKKDDFLKTVIMSPVDGIVVSVGVKEKDVLSQQDYSSKGTIQVVDTSQIKFSGTVDEIDILKIRAGQKAAISVDAFPDRKFNGTVTFISPYGTASSGGVVKFNITILLDPSDVDLKGGLTATADIAVKTVKDALVIPLTAISTDDKGAFVNVVKDETTGATEKRYITQGEQNEQYVQITSGLNEGEKVQLIQKATGITTNTMMGPPGGGGPPSGGGPPR